MLRQYGDQIVVSGDEQDLRDAARLLMLDQMNRTLSELKATGLRSVQFFERLGDAWCSASGFGYDTVCAYGDSIHYHLGWKVSAVTPDLQPDPA